MGRLIDLTGKSYGRLKVLCRAPDKVYNNGRRKAFWECLCDCGNTKVIAGDNLKQGITRSCSCLNKEIVSGRADPLRREFPSEYESYRAMKDRVSNLPWYIDKGITCHKNWGDFRSFLKDMGPKPNSKYTLDRIDTKGNYSRENCRWATRAEQAYNRGKSATNTTGVVGVSLLRGKYQACISYQGEHIYLGLFDNIEDAAKARADAEVLYYGYTPNY